MSAARPLPPMLKLALEMGPLAVFFLANSRPALLRPLVAGLLPASLPAAQEGLFVATAAFMLAMAVALAVHWALARRLPVMPLVSGALVLVFGGLTLWLADERFIKMKPTIVNLLFGTTLLGGLALGRPLLPYVLDSVLDLDAAGWRHLTRRWGLFFLLLAALNEVAWRGLSTDGWINFKVFATAPLTLLFALSQAPLIMRHQKAPEPADPPIASPDGG